MNITYITQYQNYMSSEGQSLKCSKPKDSEWKILPNIRPVNFKQSRSASYENCLAESTKAEYLPTLEPSPKNITNITIKFHS